MLGTSNTHSKAVDQIFALYQPIEIRALDEVTLFLGMTGSGKSTTTLFVADTDLESVRVAGSAGFIIIDKDERISRNSTLLSKTLIPELIEVNGRKYFDCPGFSDTRSVAHDVTVSYYMHKLLSSVKTVKIVFVVSYSSLVSGGDRREFTELIEQANKLIRNITKYSDGIALIASKVDNTYFELAEEHIELVSDEAVIDGIYSFLSQAKVDLQSLNGNSTSSLQNQRDRENSINFIDMIGQRNDTTRQKIGIFRKPMRQGKLKNIKVLNKGKILMKKIIGQNLQYVAVDKNDVGFTISNKWMNDVIQIIADLEDDTTIITSSFGPLIEGHYALHKMQYKDPFALYEQLVLTCTALRSAKSNELDTFSNQIDAISKSFGIDALKSGFTNLKRNLEYMKFLSKVVRKTLSAQKYRDDLNRIARDLEELLNELLKRQLENTFAIAVDELGENILNEQKQNMDLDLLQDKVCSIYNNLSHISTEQSLLFVKDFVDVSRKYSYLSIENLTVITNAIDFINLYGSHQLLKSTDILNRQNAMSKRLKDSCNWYHFLVDLNEKAVSSMSDESNANLYALFLKSSLQESQKISVSDIGLKEFISPLLITLDRNVENMEINYFELSLLKKILSDNLLGYNVRRSANRITITRKHIKISDVIEMDEWKNATDIEIFAQEKVIFDADIVKIGEEVHLSIIAPTWDIFGTREINLNGASGKPYYSPKAANGVSSVNGQDGKPGLPGSPAGSFFGIGDVFSHNTLTILANGGDGDAGQDGGDGW